MFTRVLPSTVLIPFLLCAAVRAEVSSSLDHAVIDGVKIAFGSVVEVSGLCYSEESFAQDYAPAFLHGLRINGKPTQSNIAIYLMSNGHEGGPSFKQLRTQIRNVLFCRGPLDNSQFNFGEKRCVLVVETIQQTDAKALSFGDFINRDAAFDGVALPSGKFEHANATAVIEGLASWPTKYIGKQIEVRGLVRRDERTWRIDRPSWKLINLEEQVGDDTALKERFGV